MEENLRWDGGCGGVEDDDGESEDDDFPSNYIPQCFIFGPAYGE